ncbi:hypothetical protein [Hymenobacter arizonensis]|nr:hypothetical protein [Hymenobacter arizonensis]
MHAYLTFPVIAVYLLWANAFRNVFFLLYGLLACIIILVQGQHYWKLKLHRLIGKDIEEEKNLQFFKQAKRLNLALVALMPIVGVVQWYVADWEIKAENLLAWALLANAFAVLEHLNYYHRQLSIDNMPDVHYVIRNKKLKISSLAKDLAENKI